jgi:hypothetical protein
MQWSKLKTKVKSFICDELADRVDFYVTSYRKSHDGVDKVWITFDGQKVFTIKHYDYAFAERNLYWTTELKQKEIQESLLKNEIYNPQEFGESLAEYLKLPISDSLTSSNPIIKAFAIIDKRVGKRTLEKLEITDSESELIKLFFNLRINQ